MRTPLLLGLPVVGSLVLAIVVGVVVGHPIWLRIVVCVATIGACLVVLRFVFDQPWARLLRYREGPQ